MIMTISKESSTLYDQIEYQGDPSTFAWVLPYAGNITVGLSADIVFTSLDALTKTTILPPPGCVPNYSNAAAGSSGSSGTSGQTSSGGGAGGVTVIKHETVGPYDTVQLAATDPAALETWLKANNYDLPPDVQPVVDEYVKEHFNFLALKLQPDKGITDMRPVRVTTQGGTNALPLRMVAAGTGAQVGIELWVISDGRYEPQNFGSFIVDNNDLGWDVATSSSNYTAVRQAVEKKGNNAVWEIESSTFLATTQLQYDVQYGYSGYYGNGSSGASGTSGGTSGTNGGEESDYLPVKNGDVIVKTADQVRDEDLAILAPSSASTRVTRMRADLAKAALAQDLILRASADQNILDSTRQLTRCGLPGDPNSTVIVPGQSVSYPSDPAATADKPPVVTVGGGSGCNTSGQQKSPLEALALGFLAVAIGQSIRRRVNQR
jgi:hypothetical protein